MTNIWLVSDTHFGHKNIIHYSGRPYSSLNEMDEALVENWNSVVKPEDTVFHLGDVYFHEGKRYVHKLNGHKNLIIGNHDIGKDPVLLNNFETINMGWVFKKDGLLLSHVPLHVSQLVLPSGMYTNVHGHIHEKDSPEGNYLNICVEKINYTPISLEDLKAKIKV